MAAYAVLILSLFPVGLYLFWMYKKHPLLFKAVGIFSMIVFGIALLSKLHDLKECITYSVATILFTLGTEEAIELKQQLHQKLINEEQRTNPTNDTPQRKLLRLVNPAGIILVLLIALGFYINIKLPPPIPAYMP